MNCLLVDPTQLSEDGLADLDERQSSHLIRVIGVRPGQELQAAILGVGPAVAQVVSIRRQVVRVRLILTSESAEKGSRLHLILALPRPKTVHRIVQDATCLGVTRIDLINAWRVEKSYFDSPRLDPERLRSAAILGAEQACRHDIPKIHVIRFFRQSVEDQLDKPEEPEEPDGLVRLVAHPREAKTIEEELLSALAPAARDVVLAIGPEGGWIERELESWQSAGFRSVSLGRATLRSETAVSAALAQTNLCRRLARKADRA